MKKRLVRRPASARADQLYESGRRKYGKGDLRGALRDYTRAVKADAGKAAAYLERGNVRRLLEDHSGAIADYSAALKADPKMWQAPASIGILMAQLGGHEEAIREFTRAIRMKPGEAILYCHRGTVWATLLDPQGALKDFTRAIRRDSSLAWAYCGRGSAHWILSRLSKADGEVLLPAIRIRPSRSESRRHLRAARADYEAGLRLNDPDCRDRLRDLGRMIERG